jgi:hypothetical protein
MNKVLLQKSLLGNIGKYCIYDNQKMLKKTRFISALLFIPGVYYISKGLKEEFPFYFYSGTFFALTSLVCFRRLLKEPKNVYLLQNGSQI